MRRRNSNRAVSAPVMEPMEPRLLLASSLVISEFMADNTKTLKDKDNAYSDWLEICNTGASAVNLQGYFLTDEASFLTKWQFPSVSVPAYGYLVVFASDKNITTGPELHTNFAISAGGEYLALVEPDGHTIAYEYAPEYPNQFADVSYGPAQAFATQTLVASNAPAAAYIPLNNNLGLTWTNWNYDDSPWTLRGTNGVGYETVVAGLGVRDYLANISLSTVQQAESVISTPSNRRDQTVYAENAPYINYYNNGVDAHFNNGRNLPGVIPAYTYIANVAMEARGWITIPQAGLYTFGASSDDGFSLAITGATTTWVQNSTTPAGSSVMDFQGTRTAADTFATYNFPTAGQYPMRMVWFQGTSTAEVELFATPGNYRAFNYTDYKLVGDAANGGLAAQCVPVSVTTSYESLICTDVKTAMYQVNASAYIRIPFTLADANAYNSLTLKMKYDDGFVAYLNGTPVASRYAPGTVTYNSPATAERPRANAVQYEEIDLSAYVNALRTGANVLAIQGLNYSASNEDFLILAELTDTDLLISQDLHYFATPTPRALNVSADFAWVKDTKFDIDRGFFTAPFDVTITTATPGATIRYTTDGSAPTEMSPAYTGPIHMTTTTTLRAKAFKTGFQPSNVDTQTYLFLADVIRQTGAGFPTTWGGTAADYAMDPDVVNSAAYKNTIINDLKAIPTMSLVMNTSEMFGGSGIYSNPNSQGEAWERACSLELINPDGMPGFQADAGIRIYGGVGRSPSVKKHSFRIFFNDNQYGPEDLHYPLFSDSPVDEFDSIILRAQFNDAWGPMSWNAQSVFARDAWAMGAELAMGQPASYTNYVHLYINGLYWGLYAPTERPDQHFAAAHLGGSADDYDAINSYPQQPIAGTNTAWNQMMAAANAGLTSAAAYQAFQQMVDVVNLADYCMLQFYTQNWDWDDHNWYGARDRTGGQWHFFPWDTEWILPMDYVNASNMINTNRTDRPSHVFQQLRQNADFKILFADRVYKNCFNNGALTPAAAKARLQSIVDVIDRAIVGESARWGDYNREPPYTRDVEWVAERNRLLNTYFPNRTGVFVGQLRSAGLYPNTNAPGFSQEGGTITPGFEMTLSNPNASGTLYYTLDGSDPRQSGGGVSGSAQEYSGVITLQESTMVRARIKNGTEWSALHEAAFVLTTPPALRVTELMYHPENPPTGSQYMPNDFEFIEVKNIGSKPLAIGGMHFDSGITFTFPNITLPVNDYAVVVSNLPAFKSRYSNWQTMTIAGEYTGNLNNAGELVTLEGKFHEAIQSFTYSPLWYPPSDGDGYSLNVIDAMAPTATWNLKENWFLSNYVGGSPGIDNSGLKPGSIAINEALTHTDADPRGDWVELKNTTADPIDIGGWYLSDSRTDLTKYQIASGTTLQPGQYLLLTQAANFGNLLDPGCRTSFGFSEYGETIFLTGIDSQGRMTGYREEQDFGASDREVAFTRYITSTGNVEFVAEANPTPLAANAYPKIGPVIINEVMYHPANDTDEFIELANVTGAAVLLYDPVRQANTWKIDGGVTYTFATGVSIPANGYLLVVGTDPTSFRLRYGVPPEVTIVGPFTGRLDNAGNNVKLYRPGDPDPLPPYLVPYYLVDRVEYKDAAPWPVQPDGLGPSLQRASASAYGNDPVNWGVSPDEGTPGRANGSTDVTPPRIVTASTIDGDPLHVTVEFNEAVDPLTALVKANYSIPDLEIVSVAAGANNRLVVLTTAPMTQGTYYIITVTGVKNQAGLLIGAVNHNQFSYSGTGVGLWGQYYQYTEPPGVDWTNPKVSRLDTTINFDWGAGSPDGAIFADLFSVRWTGKVKALYTESYTFYTVSEDGVQLWVNNQLLIDDWTQHTARERSGTIALQAGQKYEIKIEYYERSGNASMKLLWSSAHTAKAIIPTSMLFSNAVPAVPVPDNYMAAMNTVLTVPAVQGLLANDSDPNGYPLTATRYRRASHGSAAVNVDGSFTYTPDAGYVGQDTFSYYANNGMMNAEATVYLLVDKAPVVTGLAVNQEIQAQGLGAQYYQWGASGVDWTDCRLTRRDSTINFDWGTGAPDPLLGADRFAVRWTGAILPVYTETYTFYTYSDEGVRLWVDDKLVIDHWTAHTAAEKSGTIYLTAREKHAIRVEYYEDAGPATMKLSWSSPNTPKEIIPALRLTPTDRASSAIDPSGAGVNAIDIFFSKAIMYLPADLILQKVTFNGNSEVPGDLITPTDIYGYGFAFMTITLPANSVVDSWLKVTLKGSGTLQAFENLQLRLDGEPNVGGSGRTYLHSAADLPTGNGFQGGDAVFYVGSLRGDFAIVTGAPIGDGLITEADIGGFISKFQAGSKDADFRGAGFGPSGPDGKVTPADLDGFLTLYQQTVAQPRSLAVLPNPGPQGEGEPQPLAAGQPQSLAVAPAPATDVSGPLAARDPAPVIPVLGDATTSPTPEVDMLATAPEIGSSGGAPQTLTVETAALAAPTTDAGLTVLAAVTTVPLASATAEEVAPLKDDSLLSPDGGVVDLLALPAMELTLVA